MPARRSLANRRERAPLAATDSRQAGSTTSTKSRESNCNCPKQGQLGSRLAPRQKQLMVGAAKAMRSVGVKGGLAPIARRDARLFILGSLPGDASLAAGQYYAHPQNQFWRLLGRVIGEDLRAMTYDERLECVAKHRVGLWDVIGSAHRAGSLDQA